MIVKDEVKAILLLLLSFKLVYTKIQLKHVKLFNTEQLLTLKYLPILFWIPLSKFSATQNRVRGDILSQDFSSHHNPKSYTNPFKKAFLTLEFRVSRPIQFLALLPNPSTIPTIINFALKIYGSKHYLFKKKRKDAVMKTLHLLWRSLNTSHFSQDKTAKKALTQILRVRKYSATHQILIVDSCPRNTWNNFHTPKQHLSCLPKQSPFAVSLLIRFHRSWKFYCLQTWRTLHLTESITRFCILFQREGQD